MKIAWKVINGYGPYAYLQESIWKGNDKVISQHLAYLGKAGATAMIGGKKAAINLPNSKLNPDVYDEINTDPQLKKKILQHEIVYFPDVPPEVMDKLKPNPKNQLLSALQSPLAKTIKATDVFDEAGLKAYKPSKNPSEYSETVGSKKLDKELAEILEKPPELKNETADQTRQRYRRSNANPKKFYELVSGQKGSNKGGLFRNKQTGELFYIKWFPNDPVDIQEAKAKSEALSNSIYRAKSGVGAFYEKYKIPESDAIKWKENGARWAIRSRWDEKLVKPTNFWDEKWLKELQGHWYLDALLANWDVLGADLDNVKARLVSGGGSIPIRLDQGGTLAFRAQGGLKPSFFDTYAVPESATMRVMPSINPFAEKAFAKQNLYSTRAALEFLSNEEIGGLIEELNLYKTPIPESWISTTLNDKKPLTPLRLRTIFKDPSLAWIHQVYSHLAPRTVQGDRFSYNKDFPLEGKIDSLESAEKAYEAAAKAPRPSLGSLYYTILSKRRKMLLDWAPKTLQEQYKKHFTVAHNSSQIKPDIDDVISGLSGDINFSALIWGKDKQELQEGTSAIGLKLSDLEQKKTVPDFGLKQSDLDEKKAIPPVAMNVEELASQMEKAIGKDADVTKAESDILAASFQKFPNSNFWQFSKPINKNRLKPIGNAGALKTSFRKWKGSTQTTKGTVLRFASWELLKPKDAAQAKRNLATLKALRKMGRKTVKHPNFKYESDLGPYKFYDPKIVKKAEREKLIDKEEATIDSEIAYARKFYNLNGVVQALKNSRKYNAGGWYANEGENLTLYRGWSKDQWRVLFGPEADYDEGDIIDMPDVQILAPWTTNKTTAEGFGDSFVTSAVVPVSKILVSDKYNPTAYTSEREKLWIEPKGIKATIIREPKLIKN